MRSFESICDVCLRDVPATLEREGSTVFIRKQCEEHGMRRFPMSQNGSGYLGLDHAYHRLLPSTEPAAERVDTYFFVTNRCNQRCDYCCTEANVFPYFDDLDVQGFLDGLRTHRGSKVSVIGGEPTEHPRFLELAAAVRREGKTLVVYTNGLAFAESTLLDRTLAATGGRMEVRMTFEGFHEHDYIGVRAARIRERKLATLEHLAARDVPTVLGRTIVAASAADEARARQMRQALVEVVRYAQRQSFVRGLTFQGAVALGSARGLASGSMLTVDGVMDELCSALGVARHQAYVAQKLVLLAAWLFRLPMCAYVQSLPLFRLGSGEWVNLDWFVDCEALDQRIDALLREGPLTRPRVSAGLVAALLATARPRHLPAALRFAGQLAPVFARGYDFASIPRAVLPLVSITICDRYNLDSHVSRRCEKVVRSVVGDGIKTELCSEMVIRQLREREAPLNPEVNPEGRRFSRRAQRTSTPSEKGT